MSLRGVEAAPPAKEKMQGTEIQKSTKFAQISQILCFFRIYSGHLGRGDTTDYFLFIIYYFLIII